MTVKKSSVIYCCKLREKMIDYPNDLHFFLFEIHFKVLQQIFNSDFQVSKIFKKFQSILHVKS